MEHLLLPFSSILHLHHDFCEQALKNPWRGEEVSWGNFVPIFRYGIWDFRDSIRNSPMLCDWPYEKI